MVAPALPAMARELNVTNSVEQSLILSIFVLAYAVGPLFLGPLSEINGRVVVLQLANLFYLAFNVGCGFAKTKGQLIAFRFLAGLGGSAPLAVRDIFYPFTESSHLREPTRFGEQVVFKVQSYSLTVKIAWWWRAERCLASRRAWKVNQYLQPGSSARACSRTYW